ncbi:MAG TPA: universal stress protein [Acetobacteraceae bacterium]|jgi:nucleotide-binding universal stress UspA family protein|nr:universal stress protein [Acetobacteraceae bacterium]
MALKDILVHLDGTPRTKIRLDIAARLATQCGAHLTGVHVIDIPSANYFYGAAMPFVPTNPEEIVGRMRADATEAATPIEAAFRDCMRRNGLQGEWRLVEGSPAAMVALHARYADLTVVGQPNSYEPKDNDAITVTTVMTSGRPVLAIPFAGDFPTLGERVLVAWNASREAARAVNDALPLIAAAKQVTVLAINPQRGIGGHGDVPAADIALHLARHGVKAEAAHTVAKDINDGEALLSYAADIGADLIVSGAYGHSRARELVFGGVTRTLIAEMTAPVLLSH